MMPKKKALVREARPGLDALKTQLLTEIHSKAGESYREQFRRLARQRVELTSRREENADPAPRPNR